MANPGDIKTRFNRQYVYLNPPPNGPGTSGVWRLRNDDSGTPPIDGGSGGDIDLSFRAVIAPGQPDITLGNLVYLDENGQAKLASASSFNTSVVAGMATEGGAAGDLTEFTRNEVKQIFNIPQVVEGAPDELIPGTVYYLSTEPGKWTITPDTTTPGVVVRSCGTAIEAAQISIEIQVSTIVI
jgi:hypothetical protein